MSTSSQDDKPVATGRKWGWGKKIAVGLAAFVAVAIVAFFIVLKLTGPLTEVADAFFSDLRSGAIDAAYGRVSGPFRRATSLEDFRRFVAGQQLDSIHSTSWGSRKIEGAGDGATGELEGTATSRDGSVRSLKITFVKEEGAWRLQYLNLAPVGIDSGTASSQVPEERELIGMTHDIVMAFARSVNARNLEEFHGIISERWRKEQDVQALNDAFKAFMEANINLGPLENMTPVFDAQPSVDDKGWLRVSGHYASTPSRVNFEMGYIEEGIGWKLGSFKINVKPVE